MNKVRRCHPAIRKLDRRSGARRDLQRAGRRRRGSPSELQPSQDPNTGHPTTVECASPPGASPPPRAHADNRRRRLGVALCTRPQRWTLELSSRSKLKRFQPAGFSLAHHCGISASAHQPHRLIASSAPTPHRLALLIIHTVKSLFVYMLVSHLGECSRHRSPAGDEPDDCPSATMYLELRRKYSYVACCALPSN